MIYLLIFCVVCMMGVGLRGGLGLQLTLLMWCWWRNVVRDKIDWAEIGSKTPQNKAKIGPRKSVFEGAR